jgi:hypothetical protein
MFLGGPGTAFGQETPLFQKFSGRVPVAGLRADYPNPAALVPDNENCTNGADDDLDGATDYADLDCQAGLGPQNLFLKLPFKVVQPIGSFAAARFTGAKKSGDPFPLGELLINSTGAGGRKLSYLRTGAPDVYADVTVKALILPGAAPDQGGPVAVRIQAADAGATAHKSYYLSVVPGTRVAIFKDQGDGSSIELAGATQWASGEGITIPDYDINAPVNTPCYQVELTADGSQLTARVTEVNCHGNTAESNRFKPTPTGDRTLTLTAADGELTMGYVGLRSDNDPGGDVADDVFSVQVDPSVLDYVVSDPNDAADPAAPRILFFNSFSSQLDELDYTKSPITATNDNTYHRSITTVCDASLASYFRSLGFHVDEYQIQSLEVGLITPEIINAEYDLFWIPSSGGGASTRPFVGKIEIPLLFSEHVIGKSAAADGGAGLWAGTGNLNGNENKVDCGTTVFTAVLTGDQEFPPVDTPARGFGTFPYDATTRTLSYHITFSGLSSSEIASHFHNAPPGDTSGPIRNLPARSPKIGSVVLTAEEEVSLLAGNIYVNIHSGDHLNGEIRGQLRPGILSPTSVRVIAEDQGGNPDHPIIRGLADGEGNVLVHDVNQLPLNAVYSFPGEGPAGLTGAGFKPPQEILFERGWGPGAPETQFAGYPPTEGGTALAAMINPCTGQPFWSIDEAGNLTSADGRGHIALMVAEAGSPRLVDDPVNCPNPSCAFTSRVVFYWLSDRHFVFATTSTLSILRRSALWALGLLDSPNRSDVPFMRGDSNADGRLDLSDPVSTLNHLFQGAEAPTCMDAADSNDDEAVNITDPIHTLGFLFQGGPSPRPVFRLSFQGCGLDLTPERLADETTRPEQIVSCVAYDHCRS